MTSREQAAQARQGGHDIPVSLPKDDLLDSLRTARAIHRVIRTSPPGWSTRIGLYGTWGSGKTSILNLLGGLEESDGAIIIRLSAWTAIGEAGVLRLFYDALARELEVQKIPVPKLGLAKRFMEKGRWISKLLGKPPKVADTALGLPEGTLSILGAAADAGLNWFRISRDDLDSMVNSIGERRVTVFVDDLDRADPKAIPKSLLAFRELLDWPSFTYVLAFDKLMVASALTEYSSAYGKNAELFLEKVVDIGFDVPAPTETQKSRLAAAAFHACAPFIDQETARVAGKHLPTEPRRVKQIARKLGVLCSAVERHQPGELDILALTLFNILHEASGELASALVALAKDSSENWELLLGSSKERELRETKIREALRQHVISRPESEANRVLDAALALMHRWSSASTAQILYLTGLTHDEPAFTRKEVGSLVDASPLDDRTLQHALDSGAGRADCPAEQAAEQLLTIALHLYSDSLEEMASSETEAERMRHAAAALSRLTFLEHAVGSDAVPALTQAKRWTPLAGQLVSLVGRWAGWTRNIGEAELRAREKRLGLIVLRECDDPEEIFSGTDPYWESHHDGKTGPSAHWRAEVRAVLLPRILDHIFSSFLNPEGILGAARGEDQLATWMLESTKSALYTDPDVGRRFASLLIGNGLNASQTIALRDNAKLYLEMLLRQTRAASWGGVEKVKQIAQRIPELLPNAWNAVVRHPVPFRMASTLFQLKKDLVDAGVDETTLAEPIWLIQAGEQLAKIED